MKLYTVCFIVVVILGRKQNQDSFGVRNPSKGTESSMSTVGTIEVWFKCWSIQV